MSPRTRTSPLTLVALAVALLALLVAVGTTSYAAGLAKNSVGPKQLRNNAVASAKIRGGAVTAPKLATGAVTAPKLAAGAVTGPKVKDGSLGRADLAPGVAQPVTTAVFRTLAPGDDVLLASVGGVSYDGVCTSLGSGTVRGQIRVEATSSSGPANPLGGAFVSSVDDVTGSFTGPSGASPFSSTVLQAGGNTVTQGRASLTGTLQHLQQPPSRVDLSVTTAGGAPGSCALRVTVTPTR